MYDNITLINANVKYRQDFGMNYLFLLIISMNAIMKRRDGTAAKKSDVSGMPNTVIVVVAATPKSRSML